MSWADMNQHIEAACWMAKLDGQELARAAKARMSLRFDLIEHLNALGRETCQALVPLHMAAICGTAGSLYSDHMRRRAKRLAERAWLEPPAIMVGRGKV